MALEQLSQESAQVVQVAEVEQQQVVEPQKVQEEALVKCALVDCFYSSSRKRIAAYVPTPENLQDTKREYEQFKNKH